MPTFVELAVRLLQRGLKITQEITLPCRERLDAVVGKMPARRRNQRMNQHNQRDTNRSTAAGWGCARGPPAQPSTNGHGAEVVSRSGWRLPTAHAARHRQAKAAQISIAALTRPAGPSPACRSSSPIAHTVHAAAGPVPGNHGAWRPAAISKGERVCVRVRVLLLPVLVSRARRAASTRLPLPKLRRVGIIPWLHPVLGRETQR